MLETTLSHSRSFKRLFENLIVLVLVTFFGLLLQIIPVTAQSHLDAVELDDTKIKIVNTTISQTQTRDGQTFMLGYQIHSSAPNTVWLGCTLHAPGGGTVEDDTHEGEQYEITLSQGTNWYYRDFFVNMPPGVPTGTYGVEYGVGWDEDGFTSVIKWNALTIQPPISVSVPILEYHKVGATAYSQYWVTTDDFSGQMKALKAYGYHAVSLQNVMDCRAGIGTLPADPIIISFDDAYENFLTAAGPVMESVSLGTITQFVPTGRVGGDNSWDTADNNPVIPHLTWDEIEYLYSTGWVDLESHSVTHPDMTTLNERDLNSELVGSAEAIQSKLGYRPLYIAWPYGASNSKTENAAREADYFAAIASGGGVEATFYNKWELNRVDIDWNTSVHYDSNHPENFLFNMIQSGVPVPLLTINSISYLNALTGKPLSNNTVFRGCKVKVHVDVSNSGPSSWVLGNLGISSNGGQSVIYDSNQHNGDIKVKFDPGTKSFEWTWSVPSDAPHGRYYVGVSFYDSHGVLGFLTTKPFWQKAFTVM